MKVCLEWDEFVKLLNAKMILLSPFCGEPKCEASVKEQSASFENNDEDGTGIAQMGAKTLCIPLEQPKDELPGKCINSKCANTPKYFALFGRSY